MACTLGPLVEEANTAAEAAYEICKVDPSGLTLTPEELRIVEKGSWCRWQPTYSVPDISGYLPTLVTHVKDKVYEELWATLQAQITTLEANAAMVYSTKLERVTGDEAMAGRLDASYAQWESGSKALTTSVQTALASQNYALSQQILETKATLDGKITANSEFYQTSLASVGETMAASGVLNSVTLADGRKVVSGFRSQASSTTGSEFTIFADTFKILNRTPNGTGGYDYSSVLAPFTVQNDTVYIGKVNTSEPQITYLGAFASAPSTTGLDKNTVYKNTTDGNSYIFNGTSWALWITKGTDGAAGAAGTRGSISVAVNGSYSSGAQASADFQSASGSSLKVIGDNIEYRNTTTGSIKYYRTTAGGDNWQAMALIVTGNMLVKGAITGQYGSFDTSGGNATATVSGFAGLTTCVNINTTTASMGLACRGGNHGIIAEATNSGGYGIAAQATGGGSIGVRGYAYPGGIGTYGGSSGGVGVKGESNEQAVSGDTTNSLGMWGLITFDKAHIGGSSYPFTGAHIAYSTNKDLVIGDLVSIEKTFGLTVDQTYSVVDVTSVAADKKIAGVVSYVKTNDVLSNFLLCKDACDREEVTATSVVQETGEEIVTVVDTLYVPKQEYAEYANIIMTEGYAEIGVNAVGEGMVNVCSEGGDIEIGDYLCSSNVPGKAMKQDDDLLHNYTVAKATQYVKWANEPTTTKMIGCTYHCS